MWFHNFLIMLLSYCTHPDDMVYEKSKPIYVLGSWNPIMIALLLLTLPSYNIHPGHMDYGKSKDQNANFVTLLPHLPWWYGIWKMWTNLCARFL